MRLLILAAFAALCMATALTALTNDAEAQSAPFCVVYGGGTNCFYYDRQSCMRAAGERGACVVNPNAMNSGNAGNSSNTQPADVWGAFNRGAQAGRDMRQSQQPNAPPPQATASNIGPILYQFCREMTQQDSAELDRLSALGLNTDAELQAWQRLLDMYEARSQRCFAMAQSQR